jgi:protein SCO1/2
LAAVPLASIRGSGGIFRRTGASLRRFDMGSTVRLLCVVFTLRFGLAAAAALIAGVALPTDAVRAELDTRTALDASQAALGRTLGDYILRDGGHRPVRLSDYRGRPLVVSLVYTSCIDVCPTATQTMAAAVEAGRAALGEDSFRVVSIGFDARHDTPERMRSFARRHGISLAGWDFLSGDADTVDRLAADLGFLFAPAPQGFDHLTQTTVVDAEGRIYRQIYGAAFEPPLLVEPLKELVFGRRGGGVDLSGILDRIRLICTVYDPASGRYRFSYAIFISAGLGAACLSAVGFVLVRAWLRSRRPAGA